MKILSRKIWYGIQKFVKLKDKVIQQKYNITKKIIQQKIENTRETQSFSVALYKSQLTEEEKTQIRPHKVLNQDPKLY